MRKIINAAFDFSGVVIILLAFDSVIQELLRVYNLICGGWFTCCNLQDLSFSVLILMFVITLFCKVRWCK